MSISKRAWRLGVSGAFALVASLPLVSAVHAQDEPDHDQHLKLATSIRENHEFSEATYPLHTGTSHGKTVYYVITDASDRAVAATLGVNYVPKFNNAKGTKAVQKVSVQGFVPELDFQGTVDFSHQHILEAGPTGFPPAAAQPGAVGDADYSPLIELPDGTVLNAPQVANETGQGDKVIKLDLDEMTLTYRETTGFYDDETVHYASFDSSDPVAAAIEAATYAPNLGAAPSVGKEDDSTSAREGLIAFINGQLMGPERQGLDAALLRHLPTTKAPLNILHEVPEAGKVTPSTVDYSPLWDVHFADWKPDIVEDRQNVRQTDFDAVLQLVKEGKVTGFPAGTEFKANGIVVNCPVISREIDAP
jgi:hypothetical protein